MTRLAVTRPDDTAAAMSTAVFGKSPFDGLSTRSTFIDFGRLNLVGKRELLNQAREF